MSRKVRYHFAAPLVLTLAVAPACVVGSSPKPAPATTDPATTDPATTDPATNDDQGFVHPNPPRPATKPAGSGEATLPNPPPDTAQETQQAPPARLGAWTIFQNQQDQQCYAQVKVDCPPKGPTCNPPPPQAMDTCPTGMAMDRPIQLYEASPGVCFLQPPIPPCPREAKCKAPPPQKADCPS